MQWKKKKRKKKLFIPFRSFGAKSASPFPLFRRISFFLVFQSRAGKWCNIEFNSIIAKRINERWGKMLLNLHWMMWLVANKSIKCIEIITLKTNDQKFININWNIRSFGVLKLIEWAARSFILHVLVHGAAKLNWIKMHYIIIYEAIVARVTAWNEPNSLI